MKLGMLPGSQIVVFEGAPTLPEPPSPAYNVQTLERAFATAVDKTILGTGREVDHDFFARRGWQGRQLLHDGHRVGYFYVDGGSIGPAAWISGEHAEALLVLACREASASGAEVTLRIPGMNHAALRFAFEAGLRLTGFAHLLMSAPFGHLEGYLPSGPSLF